MGRGSTALWDARHLRMHMVVLLPHLLLALRLLLLQLRLLLVLRLLLDGCQY